MIRRITIFAVFCIIAGMSIFTSCRKEDQGVPYVNVNITIYPSDPQFFNLQTIGGWVYVTGGYRGILVYRKSQTEFMAYDRSCPYKPSDASEIVKVDSTNVIVWDEHCGSKFLITDGSTLQGPTTLPLKAYSTSFDGSVLRIFN